MILGTVITLGWMPTHPPKPTPCKGCRLMTTRSHPVLAEPVCNGCSRVNFDYKIVTRHKAIEEYGARPRQLDGLRFGTAPNHQVAKTPPVKLYMLKDVMEVAAQRRLRMRKRK